MHCFSFVRTRVRYFKTLSIFTNMTCLLLWHFGLCVVRSEMFSTLSCVNIRHLPDLDALVINLFSINISISRHTLLIFRKHFSETSVWPLLCIHLHNETRVPSNTNTRASSDNTFANSLLCTAQKYEWRQYFQHLWFIHLHSGFGITLYN
jgi:hypothetical protein